MRAPWSPSEEDVRAALALIGSTDAARIRAAAGRIRDCKTELPGARRDKLRAAAKALAKAAMAVKGVAGERDQLLAVLEQRRRRYEAQANAINVRRSGGGQVAAGKMLMAADIAHELLCEHAMVPTLTGGGPYLKLTAPLQDGDQ